MAKTILLTGANGQLGRSLYQELAPYYKVIPLTHKRPFSLDYFQNSAIELDISNYSSLKKVYDSISPDIIINSAAYTNVDLCEEKRQDARNVNVGGVENLLKAAGKDTFFIQISTDYVFDGNEGGYSEEDPTYPLSYYGKSKLEAENILRGSNHRWLILRPNVLYGNNLNSKASFVSWVVNSLKSKKDVNVVTDQKNNPSWTTAVSQAIRHCIIMGAEGLFHYGSDDVLSRFEFAHLIAEVFDLDANYIHKTTTSNLNQNAPRPKNSSLNVSKIIRETGVQTYTTDYCLNQIKRLQY